MDAIEIRTEGLAQMAGEGIHAGFPSPAQDYMTGCIDLNKELVRHPEATFYGRVVGDSMIDAGVEEGDVLVIDKSLRPEEGDMCVCFVDGEFCLKRVGFENGAVVLYAANPRYAPIVLNEWNDFTLWGVVTYIIKKVK